MRTASTVNATTQALMGRSLATVTLAINKIKNDDVADICRTLWNDKRTLAAPAARKNHHNYTGGLLVHKAQMLQMAMVVSAIEDVMLDNQILLPAILWHDMGKIWDYEEKDGGFEYTDHIKKVYHLNRSFAEWMSAAETAGVPEAIRIDVGHCILTHHGRPEWGSYVQPQIPEAWAIHLLDMLSARCCSH